MKYNCTNHLLLVNRHHPLPESCTAPDLAVISPEFPSIQIQSEAAVMLTDLLRTLHAEDRIVPVSGYRTMEEQKQIFSDSLRENGEEFTYQYVAVPGCSEHQTGLAIDLGEKREEIDFIRPDFPYTGICQTFRELAPQYGFVERYPKGKEEVTGIAWEPWHFRYVGCPHAQIMTEHGWVLEEYLDYLKEMQLSEESGEEEQ